MIYQQSLTLFLWNVAPVVVVATSCSGGSSTALKGLDISDITHFSVHLKSSSMSQLINGTKIYLQKLLKYFNGTTASVSWRASYYFYLILKRFTCCCFFVIYRIIIIINFISRITCFICIIIPHDIDDVNLLVS